MSILYNMKVFSQFISADSTNTYYSAQEFNSQLAQAEKWFVQVRYTQTSGTSPTVTVSLESSNTGQGNVSPNDFQVKASPINAQSILTAGVAFGDDTGTSKVGGAFMRVGVKLGGTNPSGLIEVWVCGRSND